MESTTNIKSCSKLGSFLLVPFIFCLAFFILPILEILFGTTVNLNDKVIDATFKNLYPTILVGLIPTIILYIMIKRYCKVEVNNDYIYATFFLGRKKKIKWNNVKSIQKTNLLLLNLEMREIYKVKTKYKETILFSTGNSCNLEKFLKLDEFIDSKNDKLILPK